MADSDEDFQSSPPKKVRPGAGLEGARRTHLTRSRLPVQRPLLVSPASNKQSRAASHAGGAKVSVRSGGAAGGAVENSPAPQLTSVGGAASPPGVALGRDLAWGARPVGGADGRRTAPSDAAGGAAARPQATNVAAVVERLRRSKAQVRYTAWLDSRPANHVAPPGFALPPELAAVLGRVGALPLYSHQAAALSAALSGQDVVVCTPTASGKSLWCARRRSAEGRRMRFKLTEPPPTLRRSYLAPLLYALSAEEAPSKQSYALMLFPLKALAQDQLKACAELLATAGKCADAAEAARPPLLPPASIARLRRMASIVCNTYDGDLEFDDRAAARKATQLVFSNIDMLHASLLPGHRRWPARFWKGLRHVVLDEAHVYSGVFGSHCALVLRRLRRVADTYGARRPTFLCSSATMANPAAHVERLTGCTPVCIDVSGAPSSRKAVLLWQPPEQPPEVTQGGRGDEGDAPQRKSIYQEAGEVLCELVASGMRPLCFVSARKLAEIVASNARTALRERGMSAAADCVESYRGGYSAAERRELEGRIKAGHVSAAVTTSALELGIDIGALDVTVHVGVPDTGCSQAQQMGRAGRRAEAGASLAVIIAAERPLDNYFLCNPDKLAVRPPEPSHLNPFNQVLLRLHLPAAAQELPLIAGDAPLFGGMDVYSAALKGCVNERTLGFNAGIKSYECTLADKNCARLVSIRGGLSRESVALHNEALLDGGQPCARSLIEEVEAKNAVLRVHVGALFRHRLACYEVCILDLENGVAIARLLAANDLPLVTMPLQRVAVREVRAGRRRDVGAAACFLGRVHVTSRVVGFQKRNLVRNNKVSEQEFPAPGLACMDLETDAVWVDIPPEVALRLDPETARAALAGVRNLTVSLLPSFCACDPGDIGAALVMEGESPPPAPPQPPAADGTEAPPPVDSGPATASRIYVYDSYGGVGLCEILLDSMEELWRTALAVVERCTCTTGCASCTQAGRSFGARDAGDAKAESAIVLRGLLSSWSDADGDAAPGGTA